MFFSFVFLFCFDFCQFAIYFLRWVSDILLPLPPGCQNYRHEPLCPAFLLHIVPQSLKFHTAQRLDWPCSWGLRRKTVKALPEVSHWRKLKRVQVAPWLLGSSCRESAGVKEGSGSSLLEHGQMGTLDSGITPYSTSHNRISPSHACIDLFQRKIQ